MILNDLDNQSIESVDYEEYRWNGDKGSVSINFDTGGSENANLILSRKDLESLLGFLKENESEEVQGNTLKLEVDLDSTAPPKVTLSGIPLDNLVQVDFNYCTATQDTPTELSTTIEYLVEVYGVLFKEKITRTLFL